MLDGSVMRGVRRFRFAQTDAMLLVAACARICWARGLNDHEFRFVDGSMASGSPQPLVQPGAVR
jgi:hypothetical protein